MKRVRTLISMRTFVHVQNFFLDQRSPPITDDYRRLQRSPAFTQSSSGAIPATMDDYQHFLSHHRTLTRTSWCDGASCRGQGNIPDIQVIGQAETELRRD